MSVVNPEDVLREVVRQFPASPADIAGRLNMQGGYAIVSIGRVMSSLHQAGYLQGTQRLGRMIYRPTEKGRSYVSNF